MHEMNRTMKYILLSDACTEKNGDFLSAVGETAALLGGKGMV